MSLQTIPFRPPPGVWKGIDTAGDDNAAGYVITPERAAELRAADVFWVARYLRTDGKVPAEPTPGGEYGPGVPDGCYPLSIAESRWILEAGLGIVPVQFGSFGKAHDGAARGDAAVQAADLLGFPKGVHLFADVEGPGPQRAGAAACEQYIEAYAARAIRGQQLAGLYLTGQVPLNSSLLYGLAGISCYWSAAGPVPPNPLPRGYAIEQDRPTRVAGIACDTDTMRPDRFGLCPSIVATPEIAAAWICEAMGRLSVSLMQAVCPA